ncbi:MAG: amidohydrolase family protein [Acidobacteriota bacterium]
MKAYWALAKIDLKLALRNKGVIFFNYLFPLLFFFVFAEMMDAEKGGAITYVVSMVLVLGILGNGLFGAGVRAVQERELNILRRYKVTPISPAPLLVASLTTGLLVFLPVIFIVLGLAHFMYGMPIPDRMFSLLGLIMLGSLAFRALGLILAAVVNTMQESQLLIQLIYMPMLFLSGATFPITMLPSWARIFSQYLPASYLVTGFQGVFFREQTFWQNWQSVLALLATIIIGLFISVQIFRWEKEEKIKASAKLWVVAVMLPFLILGTYQAYRQDQIRQAEILYRDMQRSQSYLIRGARIFVGNGPVIEAGAVLVKNGKIQEVYDGQIPDPKTLNAEAVEASGKTLLPGLIDVHVHLGAPAGVLPSDMQYAPAPMMTRALTAYLYCGVTTVKSVGDSLEDSLKLRSRIQAAELLGATLYACGPMFTAQKGHGTEYFDSLPGVVRELALRQWVRTPGSPEQAKEQVRELKEQGVDGIKAILEGGSATRLFDRMDLRVLLGVAEEAGAQRLPLVIHTGSRQDVADALSVGAAGIEHGSSRDELPEALLKKMVAAGAFYDPTLTVLEALRQLEEGRADLLDGSLVQQVESSAIIDETRDSVVSGKFAKGSVPSAAARLEMAQANLRRAYEAGVSLVAGSDAGNLLVMHGPSLHRELQLWVEAGIPPYVALQGATYNAARLLRAEKRIGSIQKGLDADLLLVDGDPTRDISATERISVVFYQGERLNRSKLLNR